MGEQLLRRDDAIARWGDDPQRWPGWTCLECTQRNTGWTFECGRCQAHRRDRQLGLSATEAREWLEMWERTRGTLAVSFEPSAELLDEVRAIATTQLLEIRVDRRLAATHDAQARDELIEWFAIVVTGRGPVEEAVRPQRLDTDLEDVDDAWRRTFAQLGVAI